MRGQSSCVVAAISIASVALIACAKPDNAAPTMDAAHPQAGPQSPTNNGVSQLNNNDARASVTDTGAVRGTVPGTGNATSTSPPDSASRRNGTVPPAHP